MAIEKVSVRLSPKSSGDLNGNITSWSTELDADGHVRSALALNSNTQTRSECPPVRYRCPYAFYVCASML